MLVTRTNIFGKTAVMEIPILPDQLREIENRGHRLIQDIAPYLSADQREFFITGLLPAEFDEMCGSDERS